MSATPSAVSRVAMTAIRRDGVSRPRLDALAQRRHRRRRASPAGPARSRTTTVTTVPTSSETTIVRVSITRAVRRQVDADGLEQRPQADRRDDAERRGRRRDPRTPSTRPSPSTERSTWRARGAERPQQRELAVRWATVIEKVLKMMNAPTNSEMPAKASSAVVRKPRLSRMSLRLLGRLLLARCARSPTRGSDPLELRAELVGGRARASRPPGSSRSAPGMPHDALRTRAAGRRRPSSRRRTPRP